MSRKGWPPNVYDDGWAGKARKEARILAEPVEEPPPLAVGRVVTFLRDHVPGIGHRGVVTAFEGKQPVVMWNNGATSAHPPDDVAVVYTRCADAVPAWPPWQPIETVPRDGTIVLVAAARKFYPDEFVYRLCSFRGDTAHPALENLVPRYWMPLPGLPEVSHG